MRAKVPDRTITQQVCHRLANRGIRSPCLVEVRTQNGDVTLLGSVQYAHQKGAVMQAVNGITGVRRVIDQMVIKPAIKR